MSRKSLRGLTLIELLLATSLFVILGTILYSILSQGIVFLKRSESELAPPREERIILGKIAADVRVAFIHQWVRFLGEADQIYFCGLRRMKDDPSGIPRLFKIHYYVLEKDVGTQKKGLYLTEYPVEQSFLDSPPPGRRITDIFEDFHFEYGYWNPIESKIITKEKWTDSEKIPKIVILSGKSQKEKEFAKTIILPIGELMEFEEEEEEEDDDDDHDDSRYEAQAGSIRNSVNSQTSSYPKGTADRFSKGIGWGTGAPASGSRGTHGRQSVELQKEEEEETELPKMMPIDE